MRVRNGLDERNLFVLLSVLVSGVTGVLACSFCTWDTGDGARSRSSGHGVVLRAIFFRAGAITSVKWSLSLAEDEIQHLISV